MPGSPLQISAKHMHAKGKIFLLGNQGARSSLSEGTLVLWASGPKFSHYFLR